MYKSIKEEILYLEKTIKEIMKFNINDLDFNSEAALIRHFEVIGGIAKEMYRSNVKEVKTNPLWIKAIRTRDKISHSYFTLTVKPLLSAIKDMPLFIKSIEIIKKELS